MLALPILVIVHFWSLKYTKRKALKFANFEVIEKITGRRIISKNWTLLFVRFAILMLLILSASGLIWWHTDYGSDFNYAILIDASNSMKVDDIKPTRMEAAKQAALEFVDALPGQAKIAVLSFTGTTFVRQRLSESKSEVKDAIKGITVESIGGTAIGDAMITTSNLFFNEKEGNVIVLITDGQSTLGIDVISAIEYLNENSVMVYTIGVGTEEGGILVGEILSKLDEIVLIQLAEDTNGQYFRVNNLDEMKQAFKSVANFRRKRIGTNLTASFLLIALIGLLIEWGLMNSKYRSLP